MQPVTYFLTDKPGSPKEITVTDIKATEAKIEWDEPEDDGSAEVIGFQIEICDMDDAPDR